MHMCMSSHQLVMFYETLTTKQAIMPAPTFKQVWCSHAPEELTIAAKHNCEGKMKNGTPFSG